MTDKQRIRALELKVAKLTKALAVLEAFKASVEAERQWDLDQYI